VPEIVGDACNKRSLGTDDDEVDVERASEGEQSLAILGSDGMAGAEARNAGIAGSGMELRELGGLAELPGERVLAPPGADQQHLHRHHSNQPGGRV
jgi:hypothetical protein